MNALKMEPDVLNVDPALAPHDAVFVGPFSKWDNPYVVGKDGDREEVAQKYAEYLLRSGLYRDIKELKYRDLVCDCKRSMCHADMLLFWAGARQAWKEVRYT